MRHVDRVEKNIRAEREEADGETSIETNIDKGPEKGRGKILPSWEL